MLRVVFSIFLLLWTLMGQVQAQSRGDDQLWVLLLAKGKLWGNLVGYFEFQPRNETNLSRRNAVMHRNSFGWQATERSTFSLGHAYLDTRHPRQMKEYRTYFEWFHKTKFVDLAAAQQIRVEQRNFSTHSSLSHRFRYKFKILQPLSYRYNIFYVFQNEFFFNLNTIASNIRAGPEQNRFYMGALKQLGGGHGIELGVTRTLRFIKNETNELMNFFVMRYQYYF